ncbi:MAG: hypothetical protein IJ870_00070 [Alphaproteobacteria bacterium]|nr:hypothetical protein [Alphaproteobacteria bacterium]
MVEMLGVLAIIGVLSAGGLAGYSKAMFKHKLNNTIDQITMLVTNIRTMYGTQDSYNGIGTTIDKLGIIPAAMETSASKLVNPFKGTVTITSSPAAEGRDDTAFVVTYNGLPTEACIALATADWGRGAGSGFIAVGAGDTMWLALKLAIPVQTKAQSILCLKLSLKVFAIAM